MNISSQFILFSMFSGFYSMDYKCESYSNISMESNKFSIPQWFQNILLENKTLWKMFDDTKVVIRSRKSKGKQNTMVKRKKTKGQTIVYKTIQRKLKIEQHESNKFREWTHVLWVVNSSCSTRGTRRVRNPVISH